MSTSFKTFFESGGPAAAYAMDTGDAALGDCIARLVAAQWVKRAHPHAFKTFALMVPKFFVGLGTHLAPELLVVDRADPPDWLDGSPASRIDEGTISTLHTHLSVHAALCYADRIVPASELMYPQALPAMETPHKGATVVSTGFTAPNRQMHPAHWNILLRALKDRGHSLVFVGKDDGARPGQTAQEIDYSVGLDLRNKTTLLEAHALMCAARVVIGVDGGLLHLAACTPSTPVVIRYTNLRPEHRLPTRAAGVGIVVPHMDCRFCQSDTHFNYDVDYRLCPTGTYNCTKTLQPWKWKMAMETLNVW